MKQFLEETIKKAGSIALEYFEGDLTKKIKGLDNDIVTEADIAVSEFLVHAIHEAYPDHQVKSEELADDINPGAQYEWVIDPIDGTWAFANGIPNWGVMIGIQKDGETHLAAVYFPVSDQLYMAEAGKGATLNGKHIHVNNVEKLAYAEGVFHRCPEGGVYGEYFERYRRAFAKIIMDTNIGLSNFASAASMCYLASGAHVFVASNGGMDWDRLAPILIMREAGAIVTDSDGNPWKRGRQDLVAANPQVHAEFLAYFTQL